MEVLPLEKPLLELRNRIEELRSSAALVTGDKDDIEGTEFENEINMLEGQFETLAKEIFSGLSPYETAQLSRHPHRPYTLDYIRQLCTDFIELHGDRNYMDDASIVGGLALLKGERVMIVGHQKGRGTKENVKRNFGMPRPEGYRKALRLFSLAERMKLPIITFIDTAGAWPGKDAEERGQAEAIAKNIMVMSRLKVPIICTVIGEGGSGGALALGVGNRILMMQRGTYSVISPEGCASILWRDGSLASKAAEALKITADSGKDLGVVDEIIPEPLGAAHWKPELAIERVGEAIVKHLKELKGLSAQELRDDRQRKFFHIGQTTTKEPLQRMGSQEPALPHWKKSWSEVSQDLF